MTVERKTLDKAEFDLMTLALFGGKLEESSEQINGLKQKYNVSYDELVSMHQRQNMLRLLEEAELGGFSVDEPNRVPKV